MPMYCRNLRSGLVALLLAVALAAQAASPSRTATYSFDIPAQNLNDALQALALASRHKLIYSTPIAEGKTSAALKGKYTTEEAVRQILAGTDLTYELTADGLVLIRAGGAGKSSALGGAAQGLRLASTGEMVRAENVVDGDEDSRQMVVQDRRVRPYTDANTDIPRTIDDPQPYYIFDAKTIEQSGAANVEDFLKRRLTMNTVSQTGTENPTSGFGSASSINLRGLGTDKTLILVNGRRQPQIVGSIFTAESQPDLNAIPLDAIDRIEVLPSSASGIYGGSAIGGVVNVVLKSDYSGGQLRLAYDNTFDSDAPTRRLSAIFGQALAGGKTQLLVTADASDGQALLFQDRQALVDRGLSIVLRNRPDLVYSTTNPILGATPNITAASGSVTTLTLKPEFGGATLGSRNTTVPAGTAPGTPALELGAALLQNAGRWNLEFPLSTQSPTGLLRPLSYAPATRSVMASLNQQLGFRVRGYLELGYRINRSDSLRNSLVGTVTVPASAPTNPFTTSVRVTVPSAYGPTASADTSTRSATAGLQAELPFGWTGQLDYSFTRNTFDYRFPNSICCGPGGLNTDVNNGAINPFVDTLLYPMNLDNYRTPHRYVSSSALEDMVLRGSGPMLHLPWGEVGLTAGLERRIFKTPQDLDVTRYPGRPEADRHTTYFSRRQAIDSGYLELHVPLVASGRMPLVRMLDLQLAGRTERYSVDTGTPCTTVYPNNPAANSVCSPSLDGQPFRSRAAYTANNATIGLKYQPLGGVTMRASLATAFLPPAPDQLLRNPEIDFESAYVLLDPKNPDAGSGFVPAMTGGNPQLKPQHSRSVNAGIVWQAPAGVRANLEYYRIRQFDQISSIWVQTLLNDEEAYPGRVVRDADGAITLVDITLANLFKLDTAGWDAGLEYPVSTRHGNFNLRAAHTHIVYEERQAALNGPLLNYAGYVNEEGPAKNKANFTVDWENRQWSAGWTVYYFGSYKQFGAAGGPFSMTSMGGEPYPDYLEAQGGDTIPSQIYHDLYLGYSFGAGGAVAPVSRGIGSRFIRGFTLRGGIKNVFDRVPPFDAFSSSGSFYISPFGDKRLRTYWLDLASRF